MKPATRRHRIAAAPDTVFAALTNPHALPAWNRAITRVLDAPASLAPGDEWVVEVTAFGRSWPSRSRVEVLDRTDRVFQHRSASDDGNPSYAAWRWQVTPDSEGSLVTVTWRLNPRTFWRRALLARIRGVQIARKEVPASLVALERSIHAGTHA
jgi:uncharacterized protein YndB with AHSA1/START domain